MALFDIESTVSRSSQRFFLGPYGATLSECKEIQIAGDSAFSQKPNMTDSTTRVSGSPEKGGKCPAGPMPPGTGNIPINMRVPNVGVDPPEHELMLSLLGSYENATDVTYAPDTNTGKFTVFESVDHEIFRYDGVVVTKGKITVKSSCEVGVDFEVEYSSSAHFPTVTLTGTATATEVVVAAGERQRLFNIDNTGSQGFLFKMQKDDETWDDNAGAGYPLSAYDEATGTVTSADMPLENFVRLAPFVPATIPKTWETSTGAQGLPLTFTVNSTAVKVTTMEVTVTAGNAYETTEHTVTGWPESVVRGDLWTEVAVSGLARAVTLETLKRALEGEKSTATITMGEITLDFPLGQEHEYERGGSGPSQPYSFKYAPEPATPCTSIAIIYNRP